MARSHWPSRDPQRDPQRDPSRNASVTDPLLSVWRMQASVAVGEPGISFDDPDKAALDVLSGILNGFGGELFNQV